MMVLTGVRSSWQMFATKSFLTRFISSNRYCYPRRGRQAGIDSS